MSDNKGKIGEAMAAIMSDIGTITKANTASMGTGGTYKFRGIDDVYNALHPIMTKHQVFILPEVMDISRDERTAKSGTVLGFVSVTMKYHLTHADGSSVPISMPGEGMDSGDKATAKALSGALKYALFQTFMIPTDEVKDSESDSHEVAADKPKDKPAADDVDHTKRTKLWKIMLKMNHDDTPAARKELKILSGFTTKDKKFVEGKDTVADLKGKRLLIVLKDAETEYGDWKKKEAGEEEPPEDEEPTQTTLAEDDIPF